MSEKLVNKAPITHSGKLLWQLLPEVYRNWDGTYGKDPRQPNKNLKQRGDLANYLDAYGVLLDQVRNTISQRLADSSPETCQDWLIPYFADLLDVHLVSPDIDGQREEVAKAISWRQRKGTISCTKEIAQEVGRYEEMVLTKSLIVESLESYQTLPTVVIHEGFKRVATTVRIGLPLPSLYSLGVVRDEFDERNDKSSPVHNALRPGLSTGTVDFRFLSRAEETISESPANKNHAFNGQGIHWLQKDSRGIPCYADSYQDASMRTVDVRSASWNKGHYHPNRILVYAKPHEGFFSPNQLKVNWSELSAWYQLFDTPEINDIPFIDNEDEQGEFKERVLEPVIDVDKTLVFIERLYENDNVDKRQRIVGVKLNEANLKFSKRTEIIGENTLYLLAGFEINEVDIIADECKQFVLSGFGELTSSISSVNTENIIDLSSVNISKAKGFIIEDVVINFEIKLTAPLKLNRSAIKSLSLEINELIETNDEPALNAIDSLMDSLSVDGGVDGICRLEYCTVLGDLQCTEIQASDCILFDQEHINLFDQIYIRFSSVPNLSTDNIAKEKGRVYEQTINRKHPLFLHSRRKFGEPGYAVLHPACDSLIRQGAEDGGEMGAYHHRHYVLREQATLDKLKEFLPVTQQPVLIVHSDWSSPCRYPAE